MSSSSRLASPQATPSSLALKESQNQPVQTRVEIDCSVPARQAKARHTCKHEKIIAETLAIARKDIIDIKAFKVVSNAVRRKTESTGSH